MISMMTISSLLLTKRKKAEMTKIPIVSPTIAVGVLRDHPGTRNWNETTIIWVSLGDLKKKIKGKIAMFLPKISPRITLMTLLMILGGLISSMISIFKKFKKMFFSKF